MNIIIVGRTGATPRILSLGHPRAKTMAFCGLGAITLAIMGFGLFLGARFIGPAMLQQQLTTTREELSTQHAEVERLNQSLSRDLDALALRLGKVQAEATRLNALGERLAKLGKLDDGEFNFRQAPALGGPENPASVADMSKADLEASLSELEKRMASQSRQLDLLETVLVNRNIDQALLPAGIPVRSGYMSSGYGPRIDPINGKHEFHPGVDFNGPIGSDVLSVAGGVVSFVGQRDGYGNVVEIDHGNGYVTRYAHNSKNLVEVGQAVRAGDLIAKMGATGRATGSHVHLEVFLNDRLVNPTEYVRAIRAGA